MSFAAMGDEGKAARAFASDTRFDIAHRQPGSEITIRMERDMIDAFSEKLQELGFSLIGPNRRASFENGVLNPCETPRDAMLMAYRHS